MWLWLQKLMTYFQGEAEQRVEDEARSPVNPAPRQLKAKTKSIYPKERASDRDMDDFRSNKERQFRFPVVPDEYPLKRRKNREQPVDSTTNLREQAPSPQERGANSRDKARSPREVQKNRESMSVPKVEQKIEKQPPVRVENREQVWRKPERPSEKAVRNPIQADEKRAYQPSEIISPVYGKITPATREAEHRIHTTSGIVYPRLEQEEQLNQLKQWEKEISERYFPEEEAEDYISQAETNSSFQRAEAWEEVQLAAQEAALAGGLELERTTVDAENRVEEALEDVETAVGDNSEFALEKEPGEREAAVPVVSVVGVEATEEVAFAELAEEEEEKNEVVTQAKQAVKESEEVAHAESTVVAEEPEAVAHVETIVAVAAEESEEVAHAELAVEAEESEDVAHVEPTVAAEESEDVAHVEPTVVVEETEEVAHAEPTVVVEESEEVAHAELTVEAEESEDVAHVEPTVVVEETQAVAHVEPTVVVEETEEVAHAEPTVVVEESEVVAHAEPTVVAEKPEAVAHVEPTVVAEKPEAIAYAEPAIAAAKKTEAVSHVEPAVAAETPQTLVAPSYTSAVNRLLERAGLDQQDDKKPSLEPVAYGSTDRTEQQPKQQAVPVSQPRPEPTPVPTPEPEIIQPPFVKPQLDLLTPSPPISDDDDEHTQIQKLLLEETLSNFNVSAHVVGIVKGPSVTRFELQPAPGVKVNKITSLVDDIKLNLAAKDIRIEAPIPGRNAIGIEVPNLASQPVMIEKIIGSDKFQEHSSPLAVALGMDIGGEPIIADIKKMPHGLIAGSTGSGKSVCINSIIVSLLYKATPEQVRLLLIDPKMVELAPYNHLPHLVTPVVTEAKQATAALKWCVEEMEKRYALFVDAGVRDIDRYNQTTDDTLPYIVIVIDELADLMMVSPQDVEECIIRIAQKARACGIHLLLATQRPSVDVITGNIKANVPTRLAFAVFSQVDSRTILDQSGAERLLGRGDMLFLESGTTPVRLQGNFVSDDEIERITQMIKKQRKPAYFFSKEDLEQQVQSFDAGDDPLYYEALVFVAEQGHASASGLQRRFRVGYNRAARLIEMMESDGYVAGQSGGKARAVLITLEDAQAVVEGSSLL